MERLRGETFAEELTQCVNTNGRAVAVILKSLEDKRQFVNELYRLLVSPFEDSVRLEGDWSFNVSNCVFRAPNRSSFLHIFCVNEQEKFSSYRFDEVLYDPAVSGEIADFLFGRMPGSASTVQTANENIDKIDDELKSFIDGFARKEKEST